MWQFHNSRPWHAGCRNKSRANSGCVGRVAGLRSLHGRWHAHCSCQLCHDGTGAGRVSAMHVTRVW
jgi:hypothetical protein